jgi:hypothetical protein
LAIAETQSPMSAKEKREARLKRFDNSFKRIAEQRQSVFLIDGDRFERS